jgi:hypothetical protein
MRIIAGRQTDVANYLDLGITNFIVRTIDLKTKQKSDYEFGLIDDTNSPDQLQ